MAINFDALRFMGVPQRKVELDTIRAFIEDGDTKRINFAYNQPTALKRAENPAQLSFTYKGSFYVTKGIQ